eukprot:gene23288-31616_t
MQPSFFPSMQPAMKPTIIPTIQPARPSAEPTRFPTRQPMLTPSGQPSILPSSQPSSYPSNQPTLRPTNKPTFQPSMHPSGAPSHTPSQQPSQQPTIKPSMNPSSQPSLQPTMHPSSQPTQSPSMYPTDSPSVHPSVQPTMLPTFYPSEQPFLLPTSQPTEQPTKQPSRKPSKQPTLQPVKAPSRQPIRRPSKQPVRIPSRQPANFPSKQPLRYPSSMPTTQPWVYPSCQPSLQPSRQPSLKPSRRPTKQPSKQPVMKPTSQPSKQPLNQSPSKQPLRVPSKQPSRQPLADHPSLTPSKQPSKTPSAQPTLSPSRYPSLQPSKQPSYQPWKRPTIQPRQKPTIKPSRQPLRTPSYQPKSSPSKNPSYQPSNQPSTPSGQPSLQPFALPSCVPTVQPLVSPSNCPSAEPSQPSSSPNLMPSSQPTSKPTDQPSYMPIKPPTRQPSRQPLRTPTRQPSKQPIKKPSKQPSKQPSRQPYVKPSTQPTRQPSKSPTSLPSIDPSFQPSKTPSRCPSREPSSQPIKKPSLKPSRQPLLTPSGQPSKRPVLLPSEQPFNQPSDKPTKYPSQQPFRRPSLCPTAQPRLDPTIQPLRLPSCDPSAMPTQTPAVLPTLQPSLSPSSQPYFSPSGAPSTLPSDQPLNIPSDLPSLQPSVLPSCLPSEQPISRPSIIPSCQPSMKPTRNPTVQPSKQPFRQPTKQPSSLPVRQPTIQPKVNPSKQPSMQPNSKPSRQPSIGFPSGQPSLIPTSQPLEEPTKQPTNQPTRRPVSIPSRQPSIVPSKTPSAFPTWQPFRLPSSQPNAQHPTRSPTHQPLRRPSSQPLKRPSQQPSAQPFRLPSRQPVSKPTKQPSRRPFRLPSVLPSVVPTFQPTNIPLITPTSQPFQSPSVKPSIQPTEHPTHQLTTRPSCQPTLQPFIIPSRSPRENPSRQPSKQPVHWRPSRVPTSQPAVSPSAGPSRRPSFQPYLQPSRHPSFQPSQRPLKLPSRQPSIQPVAKHPSSQPSFQPSKQSLQLPTCQPSIRPTTQYVVSPTSQPASNPSKQPLKKPTSQPFKLPTSQPTRYPSVQPGRQPSRRPSWQPKVVPTLQPSFQPNRQPTNQPFASPSRQPSNIPSQPSSIPTNPPSDSPSSQPLYNPSRFPTDQPVNLPTSQPARRPSRQPTTIPRKSPSGRPSSQPVRKPTKQPSKKPSSQPQVHPTLHPTVNPAVKKTVIPTLIPTRVRSLQPTSSSSSGLIFAAFQVIKNCSYESFTRDASSSFAFEKSIAQICEVKNAKIKVLKVAPIFIPEKFRRSLLGNTTTATASSFVGLNITYSVQVALAELPVNNVTFAFSGLKRKLAAGIVAGNLTKYLRVNAKYLNASSLVAVFASPIQYHVISYFTIVDSNIAPTLLPSSFSLSVSPSVSFKSLKNNTVYQRYINLWTQKNRDTLQSTAVSQDLKNRILYDSVSVNNTLVLGGCSSWNSFCARVRSLMTAPVNSQLALNTINYVIVRSLNSAGQSWKCTDIDAVALIASSLCSISTNPLSFTNISCGGRQWIARTCSINGMLQNIWCVGCMDPCLANPASSHFVDPCTSVYSKAASLQSSVTIMEVDFSSINTNGSQYWVLSYAVATAVILLVICISSYSSMNKRSKIGPTGADPVGESLSAPVSSSLQLLLLLKPSLNSRWQRPAATEFASSTRNASNKRDFDKELTFLESFAAALRENVIDRDLMKALESQSGCRSNIFFRIKNLCHLFLRHHAYLDWLRSDTVTSRLTAGFFILTRVTSIFLLSALIILVDLPLNQQESCVSSLSRSQCIIQVTPISRRSFCSWLPGSTSTNTVGDDISQASCVLIDSGFGINFTAFAIAISILGMRVLRSTGQFLLLWAIDYFDGKKSQSQFVLKSMRNSLRVADEISVGGRVNTNTDIISTPLGESEPDDTMQVLDDFVTEFRRYTQYLTENNGRDELDSLKQRWTVCNPVLLQYMLGESSETDFYQNELLQSYGWNDSASMVDASYQIAVESAASELLTVARDVRDLVPVFSAMLFRSDVFSANLWYHFVVDSIGADSAAARVFKQLVSKICVAEECRVLCSSRLQFMAFLSGVLGFECGVFLLTAVILRSQTQRIQLLFITIAAMIALLDVCVVAFLEVFSARIILPICVYAPIEAIQSAFVGWLDDARNPSAVEDPTNKLQHYHPYLSRRIETDSSFVVQQYQYRSAKIASLHPHLAVSRVVLACQEAFPVTTGTPYWPSSAPYLGKGTCRGAAHSDSGGFDHLSTFAVLFLRIASFLPPDAQGVMISLVPAGLSVCAAYVGRAMGSDSAEGLLLVIALLSVALVLIMSVLALTCMAVSGATGRDDRQQHHGNRTATAPVDGLRGLDDVGSLCESPEKDKGRTPEPEHKAMEELREDAEEVASRVDSSVQSFCLSLSSNSKDSIDKYISAPVHIDLYNFESESFDESDVLDIESIQAGSSYETLDEYDFLPDNAAVREGDDGDLVRTTIKKKNQQHRFPTSTYDHELSNMDTIS